MSEEEPDLLNYADCEQAKQDDYNSDDLLDYDEDELLQINRKDPEPDHITNNHFLDWDDTPAEELVKGQQKEGWVDFENDHNKWQIVIAERNWIDIHEDSGSEIELSTMEKG